MWELETSTEILLIQFEWGEVMHCRSALLLLRLALLVLVFAGIVVQATAVSNHVYANASPAWHQNETQKGDRGSWWTWFTFIHYAHFLLALPGQLPRGVSMKAGEWCMFQVGNWLFVVITVMEERSRQFLDSCTVCSMGNTQTHKSTWPVYQSPGTYGSRVHPPLATFIYRHPHTLTFIFSLPLSFAFLFSSQSFHPILLAGLLPLLYSSFHKI